MISGSFFSDFWVCFFLVILTYELSHSELPDKICYQRCLYCMVKFRIKKGKYYNNFVAMLECITKN